MIWSFNALNACHKSTCCAYTIGQHHGWRELSSLCVLACWGQAQVRCSVAKVTEWYRTDVLFYTRTHRCACFRRPFSVCIKESIRTICERRLPSCVRRYPTEVMKQFNLPSPGQVTLLSTWLPGQLAEERSDARGVNAFVLWLVWMGPTLLRALDQWRRNPQNTWCCRGKCHGLPQTSSGGLPWPLWCSMSWC